MGTNTSYKQLLDQLSLLLVNAHGVSNELLERTNAKHDVTVGTIKKLNADIASHKQTLAIITSFMNASEEDSIKNKTPGSGVA